MLVMCGELKYLWSVCLVISKFFEVAGSDIHCLS